MVQIVQLPVAWSMSKEAHFLANAKGQMEDIKTARMKESEEAQADLAKYLNEGYTLLSTVTLEVTGRTFLVYTLFKFGVAL